MIRVDRLVRAGAVGDVSDRSRIAAQSPSVMGGRVVQFIAVSLGRRRISTLNLPIGLRSPLLEAAVEGGVLSPPCGGSLRVWPDARSSPRASTGLRMLRHGVERSLLPRCGSYR